MITATPIPLENLTINLNLVQTGGFVIDSVSNQLNFPAGANSMTLAIRTHDNSVDEVDGTLYLTMLAGEGYNLDPTTFQTSVTIEDNDFNIVSIATESASVTEGVDLFSAIHVNINPPIPDQDIQANLEYHVIGDFFSFGTFNQSDRIGFGAEWKKQFHVTIPAGQSQLTHSLEFDDDDEFEGSGQFAVRLLDGEDYTVSTTNNRSLTQIFDDDAPIGISIYPIGSDELLEGETAVFEIRSDTVLNQSIEIYLDISETGQTITGIIPTKVTIPKGQDWTRIEIQLDDDTVTETESQLEVRVLPGPNYTVTAEFFEAYVSIFDNDLPTISITSLGTVNEGDDALFEITAIPAPQDYFTVDFNLTEEGNFLVSHPSQYVDMEPLQETAIVSVQTENDDVFELNGAIIATISENYQHQISQTAGQARVIVEDDDTPTGISILAELNSIAEGEEAIFQIRSDIPSTIARQIGIELVGNSAQLVYSYPEFVTLLPGTTESQLILRTINDAIYQPDQQIVVQLVENSGIELVDSYTKATVELLEDDGPEVSIIALSESPIREGELVEFKLSTQYPLSQDLTVILNSEIPVNLTSETVPSSLTISADTNSSILQIQTDLDELYEEDAEISLKLVDSSDYKIGIGRDHASIQVIDSNLPTATISSSVSEILEGGELELSVQLTPALVYDEAEVSIKHEFNNDGLIQVEWKTLTFTEGDSELRYTLTIPNNFQRELNKNVTATLVPTWNTTEETSNYRLEAESSSVNVTILDNDSPTGISVYALTDSVSEGEAAIFQLRSNTPFTEAQTFQLRVFGSDDLINHSQYFDWELTANQRQSTITIPTLDDEIFSTNGKITLQVLPSQGYEVAKINSSATLSIIDNDFLPGISIVAEKAVITEGEAIRFLIRAGEISSNDRTILLQNEIVGNFIATTIPATTFLSAGNQETVYSIPTINDTVPEIGGAVTITLATNPDYTITQANSSASVNILDDDTPLGISILPITERVVEGEMAEFQISTSSPYVDDTDVNILVTGTGDFFVNPDGIQTVSIPALEEFVVVKIPTVDNSIYQLDGEVRAEIKSGEKYTVSITNNQASIVVQDNDLPIVSIAGSTSIEEGEDIPIRIEASTEPLRDLSIALAVSQTGDFLLKSTPNHIVLPAGQRAITEQMTTYDDLEDELDGEISVTIQSGAGYSVADTPNDRIITTISDNDLNTISISASSVTITEAETAEFIVHSTLPVTTSFPVNISLNQLGQFIDNLITEQTITFEVGDEANRIEIDLVDDEILEVNGQLTAQITSGDDYVIAASPNNVAIIELRDNDTPILSITGTTPIEEGETAEFVITSTEVAQQPIQIQVSAAIDGIQVSNSPPNQVEIGVGQNSTTIAIPTINDDEIGLTGQITIITTRIS